jgi:hypothetical protein
VRTVSVRSVAIGAPYLCAEGGVRLVHLSAAHQLLSEILTLEHADECVAPRRRPADSVQMAAMLLQSA